MTSAISPASVAVMTVSALRSHQVRGRLSCEVMELSSLARRASHVKRTDRDRDDQPRGGPREERAENGVRRTGEVGVASASCVDARGGRGASGAGAAT